MAQAIIKRSAVALPDRRLWGTTDKYTVKGDVVNGMFVLGILDLTKLEFVNTFDVTGDPLDPAGRTMNAVYQFPVAPSQYEIVEPTATQIIPTQDGGKFIESHGNIFKDIRIGGTVGFRPNVPSTELIPGAKAVGVNTSPPGFVSDILFSDERGLNTKEATGFDDIIFLRNLFRFYFELKQNDDLARRTAMVWTYVKESENFIVEPISFTVNRDSGNPLSWNYTIQLRTIAMLYAIFPVVEDPIDIFTAFNKGLQALDSIGRDLGRALNRIANIVNYVKSIPFDIANSVLNIGVNVLNGIAAVRDSFNWNKLKESQVREMKSRATDAYNRIMEASSSDPGSVHEGALGIAKSDFWAMITQAEKLMSLDFLWLENKQFVVRDRSDAYDNEYGEAPLTFGSPLNPSNISIPGSAREEKIIAGENIRTLARRLTGDEANWKKLAILNNLKAPYIAPAASPGVLSYEDRILVPQAPQGAFDSRLKTTRQLDEDSIHQGLTASERSYGRDIKLLDVGAGGSSVADLAVTKQGDLDLLTGVDNIIQALLIKLSTEQGGLATHPTFGSKFANSIGTKTPRIDKLHEFSLNTQRTIKQDPRIERVENVRTYLSGDQLYFSATVVLKMSDTKLPITFSVRR